MFQILWWSFSFRQHPAFWASCYLFKLGLAVHLWARSVQLHVPEVLHIEHQIRLKLMLW